mmetsp:Transcript_27435/g.64300  ORF Transcript_27435/g.64300 Transcript_27435/m.64300 type:complete len:293 (+) Transcript_27435:100-978(+)
MAKKKAKRSSNNGSETVSIDWIASLARENASGGGGDGNKGASAIIPSKEDRKRKRESKKRRREEERNRKELHKRQQQQQQQKRSDATTDGASRAPKAAPAKAVASSSSSSFLRLSKFRLRRCSDLLRAIRADVEPKKNKKERSTPFYDLPRTVNPKNPRTSHPYGELSRRTNRRGGKRSWSANSIQPLASDYSGIGLARISLYIEFSDPSYYPKLEEEFNEHIPGFFGKQRTKAMKKQTDGNMLWRRLANEKKNKKKSDGGGGSASKKFRGMTTDERVRALIDSSDRRDLLG